MNHNYYCRITAKNVFTIKTCYLIFRPFIMICDEIPQSGQYP